MKKGEKNKRENGLAKEYKEAVEIIDKDFSHHESYFKYLHFDMKNHLKRNYSIYVEKSYDIAYWAFNKHNIFCLCTNKKKNKYINFIIKIVKLLNNL